MEENKFEKQVQQKMDELKIHPSDSVWEKIERRIEKKKRSNRGLFLSVLIFLLFLTGGDLLWNHVQHSIKETNNFEKSTAKISIKENKNSQVKPNFIPGSVNSKNNTGRNASVKKNNNKNSSWPYKISGGKKINVKINPGEKATIVSSAQQEVTNTILENSNNKPGIIRPGDIPPENEKVKADIKDSAYDKLAVGNLPKPLFLENEKDKIEDTLKQILASSETIKYSKKNKWRPGVLLSGGISGAGNNFLGLATPSANYLNSVGQGSMPGTTSAGIPSVTRPAFGFIIGVFAEKNIFKKTKFVLGINFKSFNTSNKVGFKNNTTGFYSLNTLTVYHTYINHYNFIELPVTLKAQIGKGKNIPLFWEGGFVVSELINSNALQFNQSSGYYYTNNSIFNKTQFGLNTDISVALFSKQKNSILIGPYFNYSASTLANEGLYNKKHFVFNGLRTEILFGK